MDEPNNTGLDAAILKYQQALEIDPHFSLGYARLAMAYSRQYLLHHEPAKLELAQINAQHSIDSNPNSAKGRLSQALVLLYSGQTDEALKSFTMSLKADPGNPETLLYRARALRNKSLWSEAEQAYYDILQVRPNYWPAYNELGYVFYHNNDYKKAAKAYDDAANRAPAVALPQANLATMYVELKDWDKVAPTCQLSLNRSKNKIAYLALGNLYWHLKDYNASRTNFENAAGQDQGDHTVWRDIGDSYAMLGKKRQAKISYTKAAQLLSESLSVNPRNGLDWATLAYYDAKTGDPAKAESDIEKAYAQGAKDDVQSQFFVAQALAAIGKKEEALNLVLWCRARNLSQVEVDQALDLEDIRSDPRYLSHISKPQAGKVLKGA